MHYIHSLVAAAILVGASPAQVDASDTVAKLISELDTGNSGDPAADQLVHLGRESVSGLVDYADKEQEAKSTAALVVLTRLGPAGAPAVSVIIERLQRASPEDADLLVDLLADLAPFAKNKRRLDTLALVEDLSYHNESMEMALPYRMYHNRLTARLRVDPDAPTETLVARLKENKIYERVVIAELLGARGRHALEALPVLISAASQPQEKPAGWDSLRVLSVPIPLSDNYRRRCMDAAVLIAPEDQRLAAIYAWRLRNHESLYVRRSAAMALGGMGDRASIAVPALIHALGDQEGRVVCEAATAISAIGPAAAEAAPALEKLSSHEDQQVCERALAALGRIRNS